MTCQLDYWPVHSADGRSHLGVWLRFPPETVVTSAWWLQRWRGPPADAWWQHDTSRHYPAGSEPCSWLVDYTLDWSLHWSRTARLLAPGFCFLCVISAGHQQPRQSQVARLVSLSLPEHRKLNQNKASVTSQWVHYHYRHMKNDLKVSMRCLHWEVFTLWDFILRRVDIQNIWTMLSLAPYHIIWSKLVMWSVNTIKTVVFMLILR